MDQGSDESKTGQAWHPPVFPEIIPIAPFENTCTVRVVLGGRETWVNIQIDPNTYYVNMSFTLVGAYTGYHNYTFCITTRKPRLRQRLLSLFWSQYCNDKSNQFGNAEMCTAHDLCRMFVRACWDILTCLDKLIHFHPNSILGYSVFYTDKLKEPKSYSEYITQLTCECILDNQLQSPFAEFQFIDFEKI